MNSKTLQRISAYAFPILWLINTAATIDGIISLLERFNIDTHFASIIPLITNAGMLAAILYLLWYHFKTRNEERILNDAVLTFIAQQVLASRQYNDFTKGFGSRSLADDMADYMKQKMHQEWGNKKYDAEINRKVKEYLSRIGYKENTQD